MSDNENLPPDAPPDAPPGETPGEVDTAPIVTEKDPAILLPIYVMTGIFGAIFIIAPLLVRKGPNQGLIRCCVLIATFSFWILWFTVYVSQMNPLIGPRIKNHTLAWIAYSWGKSASDQSAPPESGGEPPEADSPAPPPEDT